jgi:hypothetical protein
MTAWSPCRFASFPLSPQLSPTHSHALSFSYRTTLRRTPPVALGHGGAGALPVARRRVLPRGRLLRARVRREQR